MSIMSAYAIGADAKTAFVTYVPFPSNWEFFLATLARNKAHNIVGLNHPYQNRRVVDGVIFFLFS